MAAKGHVKHPKPGTRRCVTCGEDRPYDSFERDRGDCPECRAKETAAKAEAERRPAMAFDQGIADQVLERMAAGEPLHRICEEPGYPSRHQLYRWRVDNPAFAAAYARAREERAHARADRIDEYVEAVRLGKLDPNAARVAIAAEQWQAGREKPAVYGDRIEARLADANGAPLQASSLELAKALLQVLPSLALPAPTQVIDGEAVPVEGEPRVVH